MNVYVMKQIWFKILLGVLTVTSLGAGMLFSPKQAAAYRSQAATSSGVLATVIYSDPINVRGGPSTVKYPIVGHLNPGDVVPALGVSPKREWVQISYPDSPDGKGWVYAIFVEISGGELHIVEPPPTAVPPASPTLDLTMAAAFDVQPTQTRMPTFTPPPPLTVPQFADAGSSHAPSVFPYFIIGLGLLGAIGLLASFVVRK
jgi:uncharacterized protein YraI